ncbi:hypothetical protein LWI29_012857 [Acer saccharum]|uniref:Uncharacterized protein n=1 Tax=Acer saccharum TaxID=4024 RepID=A0AA39VLN3_ACESA|nr:hypothetical protein LWI29_012857 [Acer saccharum]
MEVLRSGKVLGDSNKEATVEEDEVVQMKGIGEKELEKEVEVEVTNPEPRPQLHKSPNPYMLPISFPESLKNSKLEKSHQNIYDLLFCPIGSHDCNTVDIAFNRGGKIVKFNGKYGVSKAFGSEMRKRRQRRQKTKVCTVPTGSNIKAHGKVPVEGTSGKEHRAPRVHLPCLAGKSLLKEAAVYVNTTSGDFNSSVSQA